ncbi:MAG: hypothetical protein ACP5SA_00700 [Candidatus Micrarchaeia archaeon]
MAYLFKKAVLFYSEAQNIFNISLMRRENPWESDAIASFTSEFSISKMPIAESMYLNELVRVSFSSDDMAIGKIFKIFDGSTYIGMFEVKDTSKIGELFVSDMEYKVQVIEALADKQKIAIPENGIDPEIAGKIVAMQEYPLLKPGEQNGVRRSYGKIR